MIIALAMFISASGYHGLLGDERYSLRTHFISELGNSQKCSLYFVHNSGLILGGSLLAISATSLWSISNLGSRLLMASMFGVVIVGLVPEDFNIAIHLAAAIGIFAGTVGGVVVFGLMIFRDPRAPFRIQMMLASIVTVVCFVAFLAMPKEHLIESIRQPMSAVRPSINWLAIFEWLYIGCLVVWLVAMARFAVRRGRR